MSFYIYETQYEKGEIEMTEKVKVTQEQFNWLEKYKSEEEIDYAIDIQLHKKRPDSPVVDWQPSEMARAFYNGYEVEPKYKIGDWVVELFEKEFKIGRLTDVGKVMIVERQDGELSIANKVNYRHATPEEIKAEKERRVWKSVGRKVGEFRVGDVRITGIGKAVRISNVEGARDMHCRYGTKGLYPTESFASFEDGDSDD